MENKTALWLFTVVNLSSFASMFFVLSKVLDFITSPIIWIVATIALGIFLKNPLAKRRFLVAGFLMLLFFSNPWITNKMVSMWEMKPVDAGTIKQGYDVGIVLGGSMRYFDNDAKKGCLQ